MNPILSNTPNTLVDHAAQSADEAIRSTQRVANEALDGLASTVQDTRDRAAPVLNRITDQASDLAHRGADTLRQGSQQLREKAKHASESTVTYIKQEPVKAMLIAAATGAALMALVSLMSRSHRS